MLERQLLVTAGGTQEPIDPVRFISNRSSGKQGYALAQAAIDSGASVTLISTPTALTPPTGSTLVHVQTAEEMFDAVLTNLPGKDAILMAAAVADFRPQSKSKKKIKKRDGIPTIQLEPTTDILSALNSKENQKLRPKIVVGFAAESQDLITNAGEKLISKNLDMIAANDISASRIPDLQWIPTGLHCCSQIKRVSNYLFKAKPILQKQSSNTWKHYWRMIDPDTGNI